HHQVETCARYQRGRNSVYAGSCLAPLILHSSLCYSSLCTPGHQERLEPVEGCGQLILLNGPGGVHLLRAGLGAITHKRAAPDALGLSESHPPCLGTVLASIHGVALPPRADRRE